GDPARRDLPPALAGRELDALLARERLERLRLDQGDVAAAVLAVALEPLARHCAHAADRQRQLLVLGGYVARLDAAHARMVSGVNCAPAARTWIVRGRGWGRRCHRRQV